MDPIRTEMMKNRFAAIVEEAAMIAYRTAHTTFIKQTQDYACALATPQGEVFAYPLQSGVSAFIGISLAATLDYVGVETLKPGDVVITNDPFTSDGLCSHTPDLHLIRPIFVGAELVGFAWAFMHASDIGGAVPGTVSPLSSEVFQEGLRLRPTLLIRQGVVDKALLDIIRDNSRIPDEVWGDLQAMLAALGSMENRLIALSAKVGVGEVKTGIGEVLALAEQNARRVFSAITDGEYTFSDYIEGVYPGEYVFVRLTMRVRGDEVELDFEGSDPQAQSSINFVSGSLPHPFLAQALIYYVLTAEPTTPVNGGIIRPIRINAPRGTVMNAQFPAASGNRWVTVVRIFDVLIGCLNQALPEGIAAAGAGQSAVIAVTARSSLTGRRTVNVINPFCGGSGGRRICDGVDGVDSAQGSLKNTPTEVVEVETPIRIRQYQLVPGTFGAGRFRGGAAIVMDLENTELEAVMTARSLNRFHFAPWGVRGGGFGAPGRVVLNPGKANEREIGKVTMLELARGDLIRMITPGGGGFGDPFTRDPGAVLRDVEDGLLGTDDAARDYGVVIADGAVDAAATGRLRAQGRAPVAGFDRVRADYDALWPPAVRATLATKVRGEDPMIRRHLLITVRDRLTEAGAAVDPQALDRAFDAARAELLGGRA